MRIARLFVIAFVTLVTSRVYARPEPPREHRDHDRRVPPPPPPGVVLRPTEAPPPPREERMAPRPGFVFIGGHWDWKDGKWAWVAGRFEKERAGKKWRPHRWEQRGKE